MTLALFQHILLFSSISLSNDLISQSIEYTLEKEKSSFKIKMSPIRKDFLRISGTCFKEFQPVTDQRMLWNCMRKINKNFWTKMTDDTRKCQCQMQWTNVIQGPRPAPLNYTSHCAFRSHKGPFFNYVRVFLAICWPCTYPS